MVARDEDEEGDSLIEDLAAVAQAELPWFLSTIATAWPFAFRFDTPAEALRYLFEHGDRGHFLDGAYNARTGRVLFTDIRELIECWVAKLRHDPERRLQCLSRDPDGDWQSVSDGQLSRAVPPAPTGLYGQAESLRPLMHDLARGFLDFGGERYAVRVLRTTRAGRVRDPVRRQRLAVIAVVKAKRRPEESLTAAATRLYTEGEITMPGTGEYDNLIRELVRLADC
jgi:hypothetical protein